jgi:hypothetical protein
MSFWSTYSKQGSWLSDTTTRRKTEGTFLAFSELRGSLLFKLPGKVQSNKKKEHILLPPKEKKKTSQKK